MTRAITLGADVPQQAHRKLLLGEFLDELDAAQLDAAIETRLALARQCIGALYPSILLDEVRALRERQHEKRRT